MRSSALAGFLASAVFVSGSAGFASTFLVGPYLGDHVRHQSPRAAMMNSTAPIDPLAVVNIPVARLDGEPPASQTAHRLRRVANTTPIATTPAPTVSAPARSAETPASDMPGPITEEAFAPTAPSVLPVSTGGPLIATEATSAMIASKLEDGEPVLTLRVAPAIAAMPASIDTTDPDNAVEPTVISAPPTEQALATPAFTAASTPAEPEAVEPVAPPPAPEPAARPRTKPALKAPEPAAEPQRRTRPAKPARVSTTAAPARGDDDDDDDDVPAASPPPPAPPPPAAPDPLNLPYTPSSSPTLGADEPAATGAPAPMAPAPSSGGPTPLTMPQ